MSEEEENTPIKNPEFVIPNWLKIFSVTSITALLALVGTTIKTCNDVKDLKFKESNNVKTLLNDIVKDTSTINKEIFLALLYDAYKDNSGGIMEFFNSEEDTVKYDIVLDLSGIFWLNINRNYSKDIANLNQQTFFIKKLVKRIDPNYYSRIEEDMRPIFANDVDQINSSSRTQILGTSEKKTEKENEDSGLKNIKDKIEVFTKNTDSWICYIQIWNDNNNKTDGNILKLSSFKKILNEKKAIVPAPDFISFEKDFSSDNEVRYFHIEDRSLADKVVQILKEININCKDEPKFLSGYTSKVPQNQIEVWLRKL